MLQTRISETGKASVRPRRSPLRSKIERKRFNGNSPEAWRIRQLESLYRAELGEVSAVPAIAQMIRRAAELVLISEKQRAKHIRDDPTASFERLLRMEGVVGRVLSYARVGRAGTDRGTPRARLVLAPRRSRRQTPARARAWDCSTARRNLLNAG